MKNRNKCLFPPCLLSVQRFFILCGVIITSLVFFSFPLQAQDRIYVSLEVSKKAKQEEGYRLLMANFPREIGAAKNLVNQAGQLDGVEIFNVINHPVGKPAEAVLKIKQGSSNDEVLRKVLCLIPAAEYRFGKKTYFDCTSFTLNKK